MRHSSLCQGADILGYTGIAASDGNFSGLKMIGTIRQ